MERILAKHAAGKTGLAGGVDQMAGATGGSLSGGTTGPEEDERATHPVVRTLYDHAGVRCSCISLNSCLTLYVMTGFDVSLSYALPSTP